MKILFFLTMTGSVCLVVQTTFLEEEFAFLSISCDEASLEKIHGFSFLVLEAEVRKVSVLPFSLSAKRC